MALIVQKFGGSSVGTLERIQHVASKIIQSQQQGHQIVVVVSAMQGETDRLIQLAQAISPDPTPREYDALVSTGEQISTALLALALEAKGVKARSFNAAQIGILTDNHHMQARILNIETQTLQHHLAEGYVVIVTGFQGITAEGDITTLGRGGSDTTAVALAVALKAEECQIYTDVEGIYTTDPRVFPEARLLSQISFEEMLEMASLGAKVLQVRSVELAFQHNLPIRVLSTFSEHPGTLVTSEQLIEQKRLVSGIAFNRDTALLTLSGGGESLNIEAHIRERTRLNQIEIDMTARNDATADFCFTVKRNDFDKAVKIVEQLTTEMDAGSLRSNLNVVKLSLVGTGLRSPSDVTAKMLSALSNADVVVQMITTSAIKASVVIDETQLEQGIRAVHKAFELDKLLIEKHQAFTEM